jgi:hypothetical protein
MGYATTSPSRPISLALFGLGLILIAAALAGDANAASSCASEIQKSKDGSYSGCLVKMGNREFTVGAAQSSAEGCSQVCSIMAELGGNGMHAEKSAKASTTYRE